MQIKSNKIDLNLPTWPPKACGYVKKQNCKTFCRVLMSKYTEYTQNDKHKTLQETAVYALN